MLRLRLTIMVITSLLWLSLFPFHLFGQAGSLSVGDRIRLDIPSLGYTDLIGEVSRISDSALVLTTRDTIHIVLFESISRLYVSKGKKRNPRKILLRGMIIGSSLGGLIGLASTRTCLENEEGLTGVSCYMGSMEKNMKTGALIGFTAGTFAGLMIGSIKTDRWEKLPQDMLLNMKPVGTLQPDMQPQLTLRWTFGSR